jgi:hypothetical protein
MKKLLLFAIIVSTQINLSAGHVPEKVRYYCITGKCIAYCKLTKFDGPKLREVEDLALDAAWNCEGNISLFTCFIRRIDEKMNAMTADDKEKGSLIAYVNLIMRQARSLKK